MLGISWDLMGFYGGSMGSNGISDWIYPLGNVYTSMERSTHFEWVPRTKWVIFHSYVK